MSDLYTSLGVSASGMKAQSLRMRVIAENIANADSTGDSPNALPYRRQVVTFADELDKASGARKVKSAKLPRIPASLSVNTCPATPTLMQMAMCCTPTSTRWSKPWICVKRSAATKPI